MKRFRALIFDVDGTLAETEELHRRAFNEAFAYFYLGWVWDTTLYRKLLRVTGGKERIRHFADLEAGTRNCLADEDIAELHRFKTDRFAQLIGIGACELRPGIAELIRSATIRGQKLAIATTTSRRNVEALLLATLGSKGMDLFSAIVAGDEVPLKKPAPDVYLRVLDRLRLPPQECLAVEDSQNGLAAASAAGLPVLITQSIYFADDDFGGAACVIDDLNELSDFTLPTSKLV